MMAYVWTILIVLPLAAIVAAAIAWMLAGDPRRPPWAPHDEFTATMPDIDEDAGEDKLTAEWLRHEHKADRDRR